MEELGIRPTVLIVTMVGDVFTKLGMVDKYEKLKKKYPPPRWEYRYIKGKRIKIRTKYLNTDDKTRLADVQQSIGDSSEQLDDDVRLDGDDEEDMHPVETNALSEID